MNPTPNTDTVTPDSLRGISKELHGLAAGQDIALAHLREEAAALDERIKKLSGLSGAHRRLAQLVDLADASPKTVPELEDQAGKTFAYLYDQDERRGEGAFQFAKEERMHPSTIYHLAAVAKGPRLLRDLRIVQVTPGPDGTWECQDFAVYLAPHETAGGGYWYASKSGDPVKIDPSRLTLVAE